MDEAGPEERPGAFIEPGSEGKPAAFAPPGPHGQPDAFSPPRPEPPPGAFLRWRVTDAELFDHWVTIAGTAIHRPGARRTPRPRRGVRRRLVDAGVLVRGGSVSLTIDYRLQHGHEHQMLEVAEVIARDATRTLPAWEPTARGDLRYGAAPPPDHTVSRRDLADVLGAHPDP
ncbi:hypothetical protein [Streptomyces sp. V1I1]|uniref:hypothetical protein n=1 Tax=Streptomyces sp. V1I1 TaxID=3042272 RepID=UPI00278650FB|nr:hypothetical protein [Streptomyces sp. V1I1]MDQ0945513.1 hypothetical protein [Streptomyces sp. V1I1]